MKNLKLPYAVVGIALLTALFAVAPLPAMAETGRGSNGTEVRDSDDSADAPDDSDGRPAEQRPDTEPSTDDGDHGLDDSRQRRERSHGRSQDDTTATVPLERRGKLDDNGRNLCEQRRDGMRQSAAAINQALSNHYDRFTQVSMRVTEFVEAQQLSVANYDQLLAEVNRAEAEAETAVAAARNTVEVDCAGEEPRLQAANNRATFVAARKSLKTYRDSLKALVSAVREAATKESSDAN